jgi:hypothetical protein
MPFNKTIIITRIKWHRNKIKHGVLPGCKTQTQINSKNLKKKAMPTAAIVPNVSITANLR